MLFPVCESKNKLETVSRIQLILVTAAWTLQSINVYLDIKIVCMGDYYLFTDCFMVDLPYGLSHSDSHTSHLSDSL